jgi:hypothetical protein
MDKLLKQAIENRMVRKPSQDFSDKVMSRVFELNEKKVSQPLIPLKIWIGSAIAFALIIGISVLAKPEVGGESKFDFFSKVSSYISSIPLPKIDFFMNFNLLIIAAVCLALFLLMFFDLVLFRKK